MWSIISSYMEVILKGLENVSKKNSHINISLGLDSYKRSLKGIQRETCEGRRLEHFTSTFMNTWSRFWWFVYFPGGFLSCRNMIDAANKENSGWDTCVLMGVFGRGICACAHYETRLKWPLFDSRGARWNVLLRSGTWLRVVWWKFTNVLKNSYHLRGGSSKQLCAYQISMFPLLLARAELLAFPSRGSDVELPCNLPI